MAMCIEREPRGAHPPGQWGRRRTAAMRRARMMAAAATLTLPLLGLGACSDVQRFYDSKLPFDTPIDWWHDLQGGVIADERPPPPGVGDPYPNLDLIPKKPTPPDAGARRALAARLAQERDRTDRAAAQDPVGPAKPATPPASPHPTPAQASGSPAEPAPPMARIEAAQAPPLPKAAPQPPAPPAPAALQAAAAPTPPPRQPGASFVAGPVPALPQAPPVSPAISGFAAMPAPAIGATPTEPTPAPQVQASFVPGSAVLRPESDAALRRLGTGRFGGRVLVLGGGDATSALPEAQADALPLAWRRARVMADVLKAAGVPQAALRVDAAALARGGIARLVD